ncbi:beaten path Ic isoform X2 [Nasonia vitripennis]|uniref:Ig-like domain-containing protein n=1 Tax=Nasonia vitripennis TaxID=7425 RepID=A0A7M7LU96_NASVI|nr:beaten path Ic isoform X2 [Nasonia vitripennis]
MLCAQNPQLPIPAGMARCRWQATTAGCPVRLLLLLVLAAVSGTLGEIDVTIKIPIAVAENSTVNMTCEYNLRNMPLYSVKWYKSQNEFYRFIPKEMPSKSVFPPLSAKVDLNKSDEHTVVLKNVEADLAGKYRCEVSTDAPTFITRMESSYMHVVRLPEGNLTVRMEKPRYALGDTVRGNCTAPPGNPAANITWTVNELPVNSSYIRNIPTRNVTDNRTISIAGLEFELVPESFSNGRLRITCRADVFHLYDEKATVVLDEERPRLASVLGTRESSHSRSSGASDATSWLLGLTIAILARTR